MNGETQFLSKKYAFVMCLVILSADELKIPYNLDQLYNSWRKHKPSRSAYLTLIKDLEHLRWIRKVLGAKKSERRLIVDAKAIRSALFIDMDKCINRGWLFENDVFDAESLLEFAP